MARPALQPPTETMGARIRRAREALNLTQDQIGDLIGVSRAAVAQWESDQTSPVRKRMEALAGALRVSVEWLSFGVGQAPNAPGAANNEIPLLSKDEAAAQLQAPDTRASFYHAGPSLRPSAAVSQFAFALEVDGPDLAPKFRAGDIVIIDPSVEPAPGDFVFAILQGSQAAVFGRYRPRGTAPDGSPVYELAPVNPDFPTHHIDAEHKAKIIGTMIEHRQFRGKV